MTFAHPAAWYLLLLAVPIVILYVLKRRLRKEPVATMMFWRQVFEENRFRKLRRRLRYWISLVIALLFLSLLVAAALDPRPSPRAATGRMVVIVDNSASMNAPVRPGERSRLDQAKNELVGLLESSVGSRPVALLVAEAEPRIVVGFTDHAGTLQKGLASIERSDARATLLETIDLAGRMIEGEEHSSILVYTDGNVPGLAETAKQANVRIVLLGSPIDNLAVTAFQARRVLDDDTGFEVLVETANFGTKTSQARLEIELEGEAIDVLSLSLQPGEKWTDVVRSTSSRGGLLRARLTPDDLFPVDNSAVAFLEARPLQRIFWYGEENFFLANALEAQPNVEIVRLEKIPERLPEQSVLVLHRQIPAELPKGNLLIVDPRNGCDLFDVGEPIEAPIVASVSEESPLMNFVQLRNLLVPGARIVRGLEVPASPEMLAETPEGLPIYIRWGNVLVLTADLNRGDFALKTAFPILIARALDHFRGTGGEWDRAWSTGDSVQISVVSDDGLVSLRSPSGKTRKISVESNLVSPGMLPECGIWEISNDHGVLKRIAVNLVDAGESNFRNDFRSKTNVPPSQGETIHAGNKPLWFWLAATALLLTLLEWSLYQRRRID